MLKISAVIPTCDRKIEFLLDAVKSVDCQSYKCWEIIVVDNGLNKVPDEILPHHVKIYSLPPRVGASRARNFGAAMASGTILAFLDDDDWWDVNFVKHAILMLEEKNVGCVYGRKDISYNGEQRHYKVPTTETLTVPVLLRSNPGTGGQNLLVRKDLFWRVGGFAEELPVSNDKAFALDVLLSGERIAAASTAVAILRSHDEERLRQRRLSRLRFVWRYRKLYGVSGALVTTARILVAFATERLSLIVKKK
ncbi:MAG: glycosyltransferase family 2 protein [Idiomarina sp.]|nr:glycosyltransferase family 2 protein [Idiomarina sp.]